MRVVVTGANSFLGAHVVAHLVQSRLSVTGTYRSEGRALERLRVLRGQLELAPVNLADASALARLPKSIDAVVHVAGVSTMPGVSVDDMLACNVGGACNLLEYALSAGASRLIYASTMSVHGEIVEPVVDETTPIRAPGIYGASKLLAERLFAAQAHRLPCVAVRLPGVLGPGAHRAWLPTLLEHFRAHREVTIYGAENDFNNAAHVEDLAELFFNALQAQVAGFCAFPVGANGSTTVGVLVERMRKLTRSSSVVRASREAKPGFTISSDYAKRHFGYRPKNIVEMVEQYCSESQQAVDPDMMERLCAS
jgi:nucleoside-diphosphate-sugar epimerase